MKKGIFLLVILFILGLCTAGFAVGTFTDTEAANGANGTLANFRCSKNVKIQVKSAAQTYAAVSGHLSGDRELGAGSEDSKIYYKSKTKGTSIASGDPGASDSSAFGSGWSSL